MERRSHCLLLAVLESQTATPLPDLRGEKISFSLETFTSSRFFLSPSPPVCGGEKWKCLQKMPSEGAGCGKSCRHLSEFGVQEEDLPVRDKHECRVHVHLPAKSDRRFCSIISTCRT